MKALEETIEYVAETGLPNCYADASEADRVAVDKARALFLKTLSQIDSEIAKYVLFGRMVAELERCDVGVIKAFVSEQKACRDQTEQLSRVPRIKPVTQKVLAARIAHYDEILTWFRTRGLLPPNPNS